MQREFHTLTQRDIQLWKTFEAAWDLLVKREVELRQNASDFDEMMHYGLSLSNKGPTLTILGGFNPERLKPYVNELLDGATHQNAWIFTYESLLLRLPIQWLIDNIEKEADVLLAEIGDEEQYYKLLRLFEKIDHSLAVRHAQKALSHSNAEIREIGQEYLEQIANQANKN